jgi:serine O-acetyltransferase
MIEVARIGRGGLLHYLVRQLGHLLPDERDCSRLIGAHLDAALARLGHCIAGVRAWPEGRFDYLHSTQYCLFLYYLANTIWKKTGETEVPTKLFLLNKSLNGIDCFYEIELPEVFFIGHSVGIVLAKATYGEHLVLYQNSTVGKNHGVAPVIEAGVVMYPNTAIIGRCLVRSGSVLSQGTGVVNRDTPGNTLVFGGVGGELAFRPLRRPVIDEIFRR